MEKDVQIEQVAGALVLMQQGRTWGSWAQMGQFAPDLEAAVVADVVMLFDPVLDSRAFMAADALLDRSLSLATGSLGSLRSMEKGTAVARRFERALPLCFACRGGISGRGCEELLLSWDFLPESETVL